MVSKIDTRTPLPGTSTLESTASVRASLPEAARTVETLVNVRAASSVQRRCVAVGARASKRSRNILAASTARCLSSQALVNILKSRLFENTPGSKRRSSARVSTNQRRRRFPFRAGSPLDTRSGSYPVRSCTIPALRRSRVSQRIRSYPHIVTPEYQKFWNTTMCKLWVITLETIPKYYKLAQAFFF